MQGDSKAHDGTPSLSPWALWAKWSAVTKAPNTYHPLLCHMIDVASVAEIMWREVITTQWKHDFAEGLGVADTVAERWVMFWAGLHDLGKACPGFQQQLARSPAREIVEARLRAVGLFSPKAQWVPHGVVSADALRSLLHNPFELPEDVSREVAVAVGGHHGEIPSDSDMRFPNLKPDDKGHAPWPDVRRQLALWLAKALELDVSPGVPVPQCLSHAGAIMLAGFVSVVDWIGSSETDFKHAAQDATIVPNLTLAGYRQHAQQQAKKALERLGWLGWAMPEALLDFAEMFPDKPIPRPLQEEAIALAHEYSAPYIALFEAPMGEGKTEAALYLADALSVRLQRRGFYFALPTQATSEGMFTRILSFLEKRYPEERVNLQLLHGSSTLSEAFQSLRAHGDAPFLPEGVNDQATPEGAKTHGAVVAEEWFIGRKRALLAPFGVGTIDQALLAALQILHVFVRLYGLSTKTIIIDEIHAYDTYMTTLLKRLLVWLGAMGVPVILLSATLPSAKRQELFEAYAKGASWPHLSLDTSVAYPRVTWASAAGAQARYIAPSDEAGHKQVRLAFLDDPLNTQGEGDFTPLIECMRSLLADGGCSAIICNTVSRAQRLYTALSKAFQGMASDGRPLVDLFHARYPLEERAEREKRSLARFGKIADEAGRPERAILIATQVIEQSLDLDFDVMICDLAPGDLVLQRLGRLHRHTRSRPAALSEAQLYLFQPTENDLSVPHFARGWEYVYAPHVLLRTWLELRERAALVVPDDIEPLVEAIYAEDAEPPAGSPELIARWQTTRDTMIKAQQDDELQAGNRHIKLPSIDAPLSEIASHLREEEQPELHPAFQALTRLTELSVSVVCLAGTVDRPLIRPGGEPIRLKGKPTGEQPLDLLRRSISISDRRVVWALLNLAPPTGWKQSPFLRNHRALIFDERGICTLEKLDKWQFRLDTDQGLLIEPRDQSVGD